MPLEEKRPGQGGRHKKTLQSDNSHIFLSTSDINSNSIAPTNPDLENDVYAERHVVEYGIGV